MRSRVAAHYAGTTHVVSEGTQGPAGPRGRPGPVGPAFEAGDVVAMRINNDEAELEYANGDVNAFPVSGVISGGNF